MIVFLAFTRDVTSVTSGSFLAVGTRVWVALLHVSLDRGGTAQGVTVTVTLVGGGSGLTLGDLLGVGSFLGDVTWRGGGHDCTLPRGPLFGIVVGVRVSL